MLDQELLTSILSIVNSGHLYYSTTYDLTLSLQHNQLASDERKANKPVTPDDRYWFNKHLCQPMFTSGGRTDVSPWIMRIICGFAGTVELNNIK